MSLSSMCQMFRHGQFCELDFPSLDKKAACSRLPKFPIINDAPYLSLRYIVIMDRPTVRGIKLALQTAHWLTFCDYEQKSQRNRASNVLPTIVQPLAN